MDKDQCCNHDCNQGRNCPVREGTHKPAEAVHQIQEPAPVTAMDALREAEAALEVAIARILKADPAHSISVTSEAKALVAVRAALAATPADHVADAGKMVLPEPVPTPCRSMFATQREYADAMAQHRKNWAEIEAERAMLATGGQAQAEHIKALIEVSRMPNQEHVADAHNAAVRHLRAIAAAKGCSNE